MSILYDKIQIHPQGIYFLFKRTVNRELELDGRRLAVRLRREENKEIRGVAADLIEELREILTSAPEFTQVLATLWFNQKEREEVDSADFDRNGKHWRLINDLDEMQIMLLGEATNPINRPVLEECVLSTSDTFPEVGYWNRRFLQDGEPDYIRPRQKNTITAINGVRSMIDQLSSVLPQDKNFK